MTLLRTKEHECRECDFVLLDCSVLPPQFKTWESVTKIPNVMECHHHSCEEKERKCPATGIRPDCPLPIGLEADRMDKWLSASLRRSAETSQAIEEED